MKTTSNETLPVSSARLIAFLSVGMSWGLVIVLYFFFFKDIFQGVILIGFTLILLTLTLISSFVALGNIRQKIRCPHCQQIFFKHTLHLFSKPKQCQSCHQTVDATY